MSKYLTQTWSPSHGYPTSTPTTFLSVNPTHAAELSTLLRNAIASLATQTYRADLVSLSQVIRGAAASLSVISAENVLATATDALVKAEATEALFHASYNLKQLAIDENLYGYTMVRGGDIFFLVVFFCITAFNVGMLFKSRYHWYNITFISGFALQFVGFLGRILSFNDYENINYYLMQYICLTISPAFIMGGIYFLFAQNVIVHGRHYSVLKPMWYSYFFVAADILSLVIQGGGGGSASAASKSKGNTKPGTWTMFAGILFQVLAMTLFLVFWFEFAVRVYFKSADKVEGDFPYKKKTPLNFIKMLFNVPSANKYKQNQLEPFYNPRYLDVRARKLVPYYPVAITVSVIVIYIRCIYRVVELKQGFSGYLVTHEVFLMTLDASMIAISGLIFVVFHPVFVFGSNNVLKLATIKGNHDEVEDEEKDTTSDKAESEV